MLTLKVPKPFL